MAVILLISSQTNQCLFRCTKHARRASGTCKFACTSPASPTDSSSDTLSASLCRPCVPPTAGAIGAAARPNCSSRLSSRESGGIWPSTTASPVPSMACSPSSTAIGAFGLVASRARPDAGSAAGCSWPLALSASGGGASRATFLSLTPNRSCNQ